MAANLSHSKDLLDAARNTTGSTGADAENLRQQAISLASSVSLMTDVINQNVDILNGNGVNTAPVDAAHTSDLQPIIKNLFDRAAKLSNAEGDRLTEIAGNIQNITKDLDVNLTVTVDSILKHFTETSTNTNLSDNRRRTEIKELIGVMQSSSVANDKDLSSLISISQKIALSESDTQDISRISSKASIQSIKESKVVEGTLAQISDRFESLQLTNEEMLAIQNKNDLTKALHEAANEVSVGNSALLQESASTALEVFGIGGPLGQMLSETVTDKIVQGTSFLGKQIAARLLEMGATEKAISKISNIKAKLQNTRNRVLDTLLFRKRTSENKKRDSKTVSQEKNFASDAHETSLLDESRSDKRSDRKNKIRESFRNKVALIRDKIQAKRIGKEIDKHGGKTALIIPGLLGKVFGRIAGVLAPVIGALGSAGTAIAGGISALSGVLLPAAGIAAAGAAGYAAGTFINSKIDKGVQAVTGGKNKSLGGAVFDFFHKDDKKKQAKKEAQLQALIAKNHPNRKKPSANGQPPQDGSNSVVQNNGVSTQSTQSASSVTDSGAVHNNDVSNQSTRNTSAVTSNLNANNNASNQPPQNASSVTSNSAAQNPDILNQFNIRNANSVTANGAVQNNGVSNQSNTRNASAVTSNGNVDNGVFSIGKKQPTSTGTVVHQSKDASNTINQIDEAQRKNSTQPAAQAPVVHVAPAPVVMPKQDKKESPSKTSLDDVGLLVLQRTVG